MIYLPSTPNMYPQSSGIVLNLGRFSFGIFTLVKEAPQIYISDTFVKADHFYKGYSILYILMVIILFIYR